MLKKSARLSDGQSEVQGSNFRKPRTLDFEHLSIPPVPRVSYGYPVGSLLLS